MSYSPAPLRRGVRCPTGTLLSPPYQRGVPEPPRSYSPRPGFPPPPPPSRTPLIDSFPTYPSVQLHFHHNHAQLLNTKFQKLFINKSTNPLFTIYCLASSVPTLSSRGGGGGRDAVGLGRYFSATMTNSSRHFAYRRRRHRFRLSDRHGGPLVVVVACVVGGVDVGAGRGGGGRTYVDDLR